MNLAGLSQVQELGEIELPIALTNTLNVAEGVAALVEWTLAHAGNEKVSSVNAIAGETSDGYLNDIRARGLANQPGGTDTCQGQRHGDRQHRTAHGWRTQPDGHTALDHGVGDYRNYNRSCGCT